MTRAPRAPGSSRSGHPPSVEDLLPPATDPIDPSESPPRGGGGGGGRSKELPSIAPDPAPGASRSRFDPEASVVYYNDRHTDYLMVKADEPALLDYLATLVAKEYVVYNNPRAAPDDLAEEMVRMLVRVRRHMPRKA